MREYGYMNVIPVKTGIQKRKYIKMDPRVREDDTKGSFRK